MLFDQHLAGTSMICMGFSHRVHLCVFCNLFLLYYVHMTVVGINFATESWNQSWIRCSQTLDIIYTFSGDQDLLLGCYQLVTLRYLGTS